MENNNKLTLKLFPNYFKKIGLLFIVLTAFVFIYVILVRPVATQQTKDLVRSVLYSTFLFGLLLIAVAKDRVEDELTQFLRLKAMSLAFVFGIIYGIVYPFTSGFFGATDAMDVRELVGNMLIFYVALFYILKQRR